ncbi:hypothetical protein SAMN02799631_06624 [Methylobacterium sp. 174MFSha1.1]|nr:hypothetical protein SAMN02799631_06624 [Methylobacterium sp. 174MFSha1.1]
MAACLKRCAECDNRKNIPMSAKSYEENAAIFVDHHGRTGMQ